MTDNNDNDIENLRKRIKALEENQNNIERTLLEKHIRVLEENQNNQQEALRNDVTLRIESMDRILLIRSKIIKFSFFAVIGVFSLVIGLVPFFVKSTSKKSGEEGARQEVKKYAEQKVQMAAEFQDLYSRGAGEFLAGKYEKAIVSFTKALDKQPDAASAAYTYNYRGSAYYSRRMFDESLADFNESTRLLPNNPLPYRNRVLIYFYRNEYKRASEEFNKAIELNKFEGKDIDSLYFSITVSELFKKVKGEEEIKASINEKTEQIKKRLKGTFPLRTSPEGTMRIRKVPEMP